MVKYFIENKQGEWLMEPDETSGPWTKDPNRAWWFEHNIFDTDQWGAFHFINELHYEEVLRECMISEHEFSSQGEYLYIKHQILERRKHKFPGNSTHYLTMYINNKITTDNSSIYG